MKGSDKNALKNLGQEGTALRTWGVYGKINLKWIFGGLGRVVDCICLNPLNTKHRLFYLKTQFVPRSKHFSCRL